MSLDNVICVVSLLSLPVLVPATNETCVNNTAIVCPDFCCAIEGTSFPEFCCPNCTLSVYEEVRVDAGCLGVPSFALAVLMLLGMMMMVAGCVLFLKFCIKWSNRGPSFIPRSNAARVPQVAYVPPTVCQQPLIAQQPAVVGQSMMVSQPMMTSTTIVASHPTMTAQTCGAPYPVNAAHFNPADVTNDEPKVPSAPPPYSA